jgi:hypothetical protein
MSMKLLLAVDGSRYTRRMLTYIVSNELLFRPFYDYVLFNVQPGEGNRYDVAANNALLEEPTQFLQAPRLHAAVRDAPGRTGQRAGGGGQAVPEQPARHGLPRSIGDRKHGVGFGHRRGAGPLSRPGAGRALNGQPVVHPTMRA